MRKKMPKASLLLAPRKGILGNSRKGYLIWGNPHFHGCSLGLFHTGPPISATSYIKTRSGNLCTCGPVMKLGLREVSFCVAINIILGPRTHPPPSTPDAIRHTYLCCKNKNYLCMRTHNFASSPLFQSKKGLFLAKWASRIFCWESS